MAPSVGALGAGLHLALEHRGSHGHEHGHDHEDGIAELVRTASHGHHHEVDTAPDHDHEARVGSTAPLPRRGPTTASALPAPPVGTGLEGASALDHVSRRGPPEPLFTAHCSLLL